MKRLLSVLCLGFLAFNATIACKKSSSEISETESLPKELSRPKTFFDVFHVQKTLNLSDHHISVLETVVNKNSSLFKKTVNDFTTSLSELKSKNLNADAFGKTVRRQSEKVVDTFLPLVVDGLAVNKSIAQKKTIEVKARANLSGLLDQIEGAAKRAYLLKKEEGAPQKFAGSRQQMEQGLVALGVTPDDATLAKINYSPSEAEPGLALSNIDDSFN